MDRTIKFRGKRIDNGEWITGDFYFFEGANIRHYHQTCRHDEGLQNSYTDYEVMPETVGQFTGLKDKSGKELHENDIVLWDGRKAIIEWLPRMAGYYAMWKGEGVHFHDMQQIVPAHGGLRHIEIIGNIHDNPEMLNPPKEGVLNMTTDPNVKQATEQEVAATESAAQDQAMEATQDSEEGTTEG